MHFCSVVGSQAEAVDAGEDVIGCLGPAKGLGIAVDLVDVGFNRVLQFARRAMYAALKLPHCQVREETLDLIDPRCRCWREVDMPVWSPGQPIAYRRSFMGGVVVHDEVDIEFLLGVNEKMTSDEIRSLLNEEYRKWNGRVTHADAAMQRQASQMLDLIADVRAKYVETCV